MPKYKYPKESAGPIGVAEDASTEEKRLPRLHHLQVGPKQVEGLEVGDEIEVKLRANVIGASIRKDENDPGTDASLDLELVESEVYATAEKKKKDSDESQFDGLLEDE